MERATDTGFEKDYLEYRAEAELSLAQAAAHPAAVRAHYLLAGFYLDRLYGEGAEANDAGDGCASLPAVAN
jgi:hypothetical protein